MTDPDIAIIIVGFKSAHYLPRQIAALAAQTEKAFSVIYWDNASPPETRPDPAQFPPTWRFIQSAENVGFAAANNRAAALTAARHLVFLNPDAFPEPQWLARLAHAIGLYSDVAAVGSTQLRAGNPDVYDGLGDVLHAFGLPYRSAYGAPQRRYRPRAVETFSACAAAMMVRRDAFDAVSGFDEAFFCYIEDVDLGFRLRLLGWRVRQAPDAIVHHEGGGSLGERSGFADYHGARNRVWMFAKCMPFELFYLMLPLHIAASVAIISLHVLQGRGFHAWRGFLMGLADWRRIMAQRGQIQRTRTASIGDIVSALTWAPWKLLQRAPSKPNQTI